MRGPVRHVRSGRCIAAPVERPRRRGSAQRGNSVVRHGALACLDAASMCVTEVVTLGLVGIAHFREGGLAHAGRRSTRVFLVTWMCLHVDPHVRKS